MIDKFRIATEAKRIRNDRAVTKFYGKGQGILKHQDSLDTDAKRRALVEKMNKKQK